MFKPKTAITPTRAENYNEWYQQVVRAADMAENSPVRGCMVIKPWGFGIWEQLQAQLDAQIKKRGVENAYFPLLIPLSFLEKEAAHVDGFAKECAVVTHHRLESDGKGGLKPSGELAEPMIIRPTSETIIGESFSKWVRSYRDLPLLINQWANVMRWEMRPRIFLRTAEFLWQEGHTVHRDHDDAMRFTLNILDMYAAFARDVLALPVIKGEKTADERFPGAAHTYTIEAMMQDGKALQAGTSHHLGQNFAEASNIHFQDEDGQEKLAHTTSWGVSTRLIGGLIMTHGDDDGMAVPPAVAPYQVVVIPLVHDEANRAAIYAYAEKVTHAMRGAMFRGAPVRVFMDARDEKGSDKVWRWVKRGAPVRLEIGMKEVEANAVYMARRDLGAKEKAAHPLDTAVAQMGAWLEEVQSTMYSRALVLRDSRIVTAANRDEFYAHFAAADEGTQNLFVLARFGGDADFITAIKRDLSVTPRCMPLAGELPHVVPASCVDGAVTGEAVIFARAY